MTFRPPPLALDDQRHPRFDPRYAGIDLKLLPIDGIAERHAGARAALLEQPHRSGAAFRAECDGRGAWNSLRAMVKMLDNVSEAEITELNIPTGVPLLYDLDQGSSRFRIGTWATRLPLRRRLKPCDGRPRKSSQPLPAVVTPSVSHSRARRSGG